MINIAIIEDDADFAARLKDDLILIAKESGKIFNIYLFSNIENFLLPRSYGFEIVFFDIELPGMNGMDGAKKFRETDTDAVIIFITSLANYAISGYEVAALDYMVKPVSYNNLALKVKKAIRKVENKNGKLLVLHSKDGIIKLSSNEVLYIEIMCHTLSVHTENGSCIETTGNLSVLEKELEGYSFSRCNSCYLVNMRAVSRIAGMTVFLANGEELAISRRKKKDFLSDFTKYVGS